MLHLAMIHREKGVLIDAQRLLVDFGSQFKVGQGCGVFMGRSSAWALGSASLWGAVRLGLRAFVGWCHVTGSLA